MLCYLVWSIDFKQQIKHTKRLVVNIFVRVDYHWSRLFVALVLGTLIRMVVMYPTMHDIIPIYLPFGMRYISHLIATNSIPLIHSSVSYICTLISERLSPQLLKLINCQFYFLPYCNSIFPGYKRSGIVGSHALKYKSVLLIIYKMTNL